MSESKYNLENLPIRDDVKDELRNKKLSEVAAIDLVHTVGRMMSMQDDCYEEQLCEITKTLREIKRGIASLKKDIHGIAHRVEKVEEKVA